MTRLGDVVEKIRSKNAGPFWVTIDIFCGSENAYCIACSVSLARLAQLYKVPEESIKRFEIDNLKVIKVSIPRPLVQGSRFDRDMHGAQAAHLLNEMVLDLTPKT